MGSVKSTVLVSDRRSLLWRAAGMAVIPNARQRARSALIDDIKAEAFRQLSAHGGHQEGTP